MESTKTNIISFIICLIICAKPFCAYSNSEDITYKANAHLRYADMLYGEHDLKNAAEQFSMARDLYLGYDGDMALYCDARLYYCYQSIGDITNAQIVGLRLENGVQTTTNSLTEPNIIIRSTYASYLWNVGRYEQSQTVAQEALLMAEKFYGKDSNALFTFLYNYSVKLLETGELDAALEVVEKAINLTSKDERQYIDGIALKSTILEKKGLLGDAIALCERELKYLDELNDIEVKIDFLNNIGVLYGELGDYNKNLQYTLEYSQKVKEYKGSQSPDYATACLNLSELYSVLNEPDLANTYIEQAIRLMGNIYGKESHRYYEALKKYASRKRVSYPEESLKLYTEALHLSESLFGTESREYADNLISIGFLNSTIGNSADFLDKVRYGLSIKERNGYNNDVYYLSELFLLTSQYSIFNLNEEASETSITLYNSIKQYLKVNFQHLTEWQRDELWSNINQYLLWMPESAINLHHPRLNKLAYNSILLRKGLLLTATNNVDRIITAHGDDNLKNIHSRILQCKNELQETIEPARWDSIQNVLIRLEREELNRVSQIGAIMNFVDDDWTDIVNSLNPSDLAIEFFAYPTQDCISYGACIVGADYSSPMVIGLFNDKELLQFSEDSEQKFDYDNVDLYRCVWNKLEAFNLENAAHIYFSPDNLLHTLGIEYLTDSNGQRANEKWNLIRLSSTREIINAVKSPNYQNCTLFGNLNYDASQSSPKSLDSANYDTSEDGRGSTRYGKKALPQTKIEIDNLNNLLTQQAISTSLYTKSDGTETVFKNLSGTSPNIIHLATHGFYWTDETAERRKYVSFLKNIYRNNLSSEERSLICSGLIFSGANEALASDNDVQTEDDGILTARELSQMNLNGTDLVVLSACETGLGHVTGEGVFGLQRGFKLAGANTLLMSLWKVDDTATQMLMTEFYKNLLTGDSKVQSLRKAQQFVRSQPGYDDPEYWAGFILLDALN